MEVGVIPPGDPGAFRTLLSPEAAEALQNDEPVTALAVTEDGEAYGALAGYIDNDIFLIVSLYVRPGCRRKGAGRLLIETLKELLTDEDVWIEINFALGGEDDENIIPFLKAMGFEDMSDDYLNLYHTTIAQLGSVPFFKRAKGAGVTFDQLDDAVLRRAQKEAEANDLPRPMRGLDGPDVIREMSAAYVKDRRLKAYVVLEKNDDGSLFLTAQAQDVAPAVLSGLMRTAFVKAKELLPPDTDIYIYAVTKESAALIRAILPQADTILRTFAKPCISE